MPVLDATLLNADPEGLDFLRDVLGTRGETASTDRRFPIEAWTPRPAASGDGSLTPAPGHIETRFADALA